LALCVETTNNINQHRKLEMAFPSAVGWNNLPNGNFSPVIYSKKVQKAFRKSSIARDITNSEYFGEIGDLGDSVRIIKEPEISVSAYKRGQQIQTQDLIDEDFTLVIDQSNYFAFQMDDIEKAHSHVNFMDMATNRAGYRLGDQFDQEILGYLTGYKQSALHTNAGTARVLADIPGTKAISTAEDTELLAAHVLKKGSFAQITTSSAGDHSIPLSPRLPGITSFPTDRISPVQLFNRAARLLDMQNVPREGRWSVVDPVFMELLRDEDSRLFQAEWGETGGIRNGRVGKTLMGFRLYESNNLPYVGTGPATTGVANQNTDYGVVVFGNDQAVATAEQINKTERQRSSNSFADIVRGLHLYGRKILRPESIVTAKYNVAA
jgi:hypothetical protein